MNRLVYFIFCVLSASQIFAQKDSLQLGDNYAEDQIYASISYAQFFKQPVGVSKSGFSYSISTGFMRDVILNQKGSFSFAVGVGYGFDFFNHNIEVREINDETIFATAVGTSSNTFKSHNLEFPFELRWRTSNAIKYDFWRIYAGVKFLYNMSHKFGFIEDNKSFSYKNLSAFSKLQYGLTLSAGYDVFNINIFYGLAPIFDSAEPAMDTSVLKFGLIFYIL